ncbi:MAG: 3-methyl-2-oxobutanoate hydroxymethyltransferase [Pseudobdellovibrionaceae bacterium]
MPSILDFINKKSLHQKISVITCYDYSFAQILEKSKVDALLVGDSLAMTMHGHNSTLPASVNLMALHTQAVVRGAPNKLIIADLPFLSYRKNLSDNMKAVEKLMQAGAHAVKLEGADDHSIKLVQHIVQSGVPVMGHLGLTPQSVHQLGGFKVQGRQEEAAKKITEQAQQLQDAGCFGIVLECIPSDLAQKITNQLSIPTIGIGAGANTDGQVLVLQDLLGINQNFKPKFVKHYLNGFDLLLKTFDQFHDEVQSQQFPSVKESY